METEKKTDSNPHNEKMQDRGMRALSFALALTYNTKDKYSARACCYSSSLQARRFVSTPIPPLHLEIRVLHAAITVGSMGSTDAVIRRVIKGRNGGTSM